MVDSAQAGVMEKAFDFLGKTGDGAIVVDSGQRIVLWNGAARRMLGFDPEDVIGRFCYEVLGGTDEEGCVVCRKGCFAIRAASRGEILDTREVQLRTKSVRKICVDLTTVLLPSRWRELSVLAHLFRDTSEQKRLQVDHEQLMAQLAESEPDDQRASPGNLPPSGTEEPLTAREVEVLRLLTTGASTETIGKWLRIGTSTVRTHVQRVLQKLGVHSRLEAVALATQRELF